MKLNLQKRKRNFGEVLTKNRLAILIPTLLLFSFFGGMFFYRSGYASKLSSLIRRLPQSEVLIQAVDEVNEEIIKESKLYQSNGLSNIFLDIPFDSMLAIEDKREAALAVGILQSSDDDYVPATMRYNDEQTLDIKLRLKGDWVDHLETDKWSFRIHVTEADGAVLGMRRFSLQGPQTRSYVSEWGFHQNLFMENVLTTRYHFVNVIQNGEHKGIYALEESFHEDLLESQDRREGIIFRMDEDLLWYDYANFLNAGEDQLGRFWLVDYPESNEITAFRSTRIENNDVLSEEFKAAEELLFSLYQGKVSADQVLDEVSWGKFFAITDLWGGGHGTRWHNYRFYYNPVTGLIEPIAFDNYVFHPSFDRDRLAFPFAEAPLFATLGVQKAYVETLERIATPEYLEMLKTEFGDEIGVYYKLLLDEYQDPNLRLPWDDLESRLDMLTRNINPKQPVRGNFQRVEQDGGAIIQFDLTNMMVIPVQLNAFVINGKTLPMRPGWCVSKNCVGDTVSNDDGLIMLDGFTPVSFAVPINEAALDMDNFDILNIHAQLYGGTKTFEIPIYSGNLPQGIHTGVKPSVSLEEALDAHGFLHMNGEKNLAIEPGEWMVDGDLILPDGYSLIIPENTTLNFGEGSVFLVNGSVDILGTEDAPVLLTAQNVNWGGMVVLDAPDLSTWQYMKAEKMSGIFRTGWVLTGGITFYQSEVSIVHSVIGNNMTEDALNVIRAPFSFEFVEFQNTSSDAFDGDFTTGRVMNCSFHDIVGDAFDVSGSKISVSNSYFVNIDDKAISVGEKSEVYLTNIIIRDVSIGVASKDLSSIFIDTATIDNATVAGLTAYIKKPQYGPAFIDAQNIEFLNTENFAICQTDSQLILNGDDIRPKDIDVDALYEQGILGN